MPNPLDTLTKPLQIGARVAFGAFQAAQQVAQGIIGGNHQDEPPAEHRQQHEAQERDGRRTPAEQRSPSEPRQRRNTVPKQLDDKTITDKVETELFRDSNVAKGKIDVNTADAVVWLRGEAKTPEQIKELEAKALAIPEVKQVENLLHLPKTPAPTRADTPKPQQKTRRHKSTAAARKVTPTVAPSERKTTTAGAEPSPRELAKKHEGRKPAPLGSTDTAATSEPKPAAAKPKPAAAKQKPAAKPKATASKSGSTSSAAEPAPKDLAAKGEGRQPAPLGSTDDAGGK